jgi:hypothetical protein
MPDLVQRMTSIPRWLSSLTCSTVLSNTTRSLDNQPVALQARNRHASEYFFGICGASFIISMSITQQNDRPKTAFWRSSNC